MQAEHVKRLLAAVRKVEKDKDTAGGKETATATAVWGPMFTAEQEGEEKWTRGVDLIQAEFWEGKLAEEATWKAVVLIPKGKKD